MKNSSKRKSYGNSNFTDIAGLLNREKGFRSLIENSNDVITLIDSKGIISYSSPSITRILGYDPAERTGRSIFENIHPSDQARMKCIFADLLKNPGQVVNETTRYRHKSGEWLYMEGYAKNQLDDPDVNAIVVNFRDVTERKEVEDQLVLNERRLSNLIVNLPGMVYQCLNEPEWPMTYTSVGSIQLTGYTPEQFANREICYNDVIHPDDQKKVWERVQQALDMQERYQMEYRIRTVEGEERWVWEQGCGVFSSEGEVLYLEGFISDITYRVIARENENKLAKIIQQTDDNVVITDPEGNIEYVNPAFEKTTGYSAEEVMGENPRLLKSGQHSDKFYKNLWETILQGKQFTSVINNQRKNGEIYNVHQTITPIMDADRKITNFVSTAKNITCLIEAEKQLQESESRLSLALDAAHMGIFDWDIPGNSITWSRWHEELWGYAPGEFNGTYDAFEERVHPDDRQAIRDEVDRCMREHTPFIKEFRVIWLDNSLHWVRGQGKFTFDEDTGRPLRMHGIVVETTERMHAELKLHSEVNFSNALLNSLPGIVYCYDQNLKFLRWNKNLERVMGYTGEELAEMSPIDFFEGTDRELISDRISEVFAFGMSDAEAEIVTRDGRKIPYYLTGNRIEIDGVHCLVGVGIDMTELKQTENELKRNEIALRGSEAQLFNAMKLARAAHWEYDVASNKFTFNDLFYAIFHTTAEEVGGYTMSPDEYARRFVHPADSYMVSKEVRTAIESTDTDFTHELEHRILYSDGETGYLAVRILVVKDERGRTIKTYGVNQDVTARKQTEKALHESEEKLRLFIKYTPSAIAMFDRDMCYLSFSNRWLLDYGLGEQDLTGSSHYEIFPDIPDRWKEIHQRCLTGAIEKCEEDQFVRADGSVDWVRWEIHPWRTISGDIGGIIIFSEVITVRKQAEQQLQLQSAALHASANAIMITDLVGKILWINQAFTNLTGYKSEEVIGKNPRLLVNSGKHDRAFYKNLWDTILAGNVWRSEIVNRRKDGSLYTEYQTISPVRNDHGEITHFIAIKQDVTERKQAEEALLKNQRNLLKAQKLAHLGNWEWNPKDNYVTGSEELYRIFAIKPRQERSPLQEFLDRIHPEDQESVNKSLEEVLSGSRNDLNLEFRVVHPDGNVRHIIAQGESIFTSQNKPSHLFGVVQDVTEQILAEQALRKSELNLSKAQRIARLGSWELDLASNHLHWSDEVYRIFGITKDEFSNNYEAFISTVHPDDREYIEEEQKKAILEVTPFNVEHRIVRPDGTIRWVNEMGELEHDSKGKATRFIGTVLDITERKRAEEEMEASEERLQYVARATVNTIWDWDIINNTVWTNEKDTGTPWIERVHPEDKEWIIQSIHKAIHGTTNEWESECRIKDDNGHYINVIDHGFIIRDETGKAVRMVGGMTDISDRLALEEQLRQLQRMESIGQLTGGIAHDFNNLLTVIMGNAEILNDRLASNPQLQSLAGMMVSAAQRGSDLTQRLLAFARKQTLQPRDININQLLTEMNNMLQRSLGEHIEMEFKLDGSLWTALVDPGQLENAILNLCINARDAMPGGGRLSIETFNTHIDVDYSAQLVEVKPGDYIMLAISDTGTGIDEEHLAQIFEPFFTTKEVGKGTGLGLSMVYGFIKQSGGHIEIYSEKGHGTIVKVYLPRTNSKSEENVAQEENDSVPGGVETILLVEDDNLVRQYVQNQLLSLGYRVLAAEDGPRALAILQSDKNIDLLFTDVVMPAGMSGRDLADEACRLRPGLKVLYTSGYTKDAIVHQGRLEPGVQLLSKPYERKLLAQKLREVLDAPSK